MLDVLKNMCATEPSAALVLFGLAVLAIIGTLALLYSPKEYAELKKLYKEQVEADNAVYDGLKHSNIAEKVLFRWTTKDVEHYYE